MWGKFYILCDIKMITSSNSYKHSIIWIWSFIYFFDAFRDKNHKITIKVEIFKYYDRLGKVNAMFWDIISVGIGGSLGALSRFGIGKVIETNIGLSPTWSVVLANLIGCFLFGILFEITLKDGIVSSNYRPFLLSGFLGSLTTFSTFTHHSFTMIRAGEWIGAGANIVFQVVAGLFLVWLGSRLVAGA